MCVNLEGKKQGKQACVESEHYLNLESEDKKRYKESQLSQMVNFLPDLNVSISLLIIC